MNILRQLWQDAQAVLRDMSVTQRVAVTFLILAVAVCLTFAAWLGTSPAETGRRPLPMEIDLADINDVLAQLKAKGIQSAEYDYDSRRIIVNVDEEKNAVIALAEEGLLKDAHQFGFMDMLDKWSFADTRLKSEEAMRLARANEVARLIENLNDIKEAQVIYSDDANKSLFGETLKKTASVRVRTKLRKTLNEETANTIIALVASAKAGLDPRDVVVTDQTGNRFQTSASNGLTALAKQKWDTEFALTEEMRRKLENLMRQFIPNFQYEGVVNAFPKFEVNYNYREMNHREILPGEVGSSTTRKMTQTSSQQPLGEPGVQTNARRVANTGNSSNLYTQESRHDEKEASRNMQNSYRDTAVKYSPSVENVTVAAIIHLPYQLRRDAEGRPVQAVSETGEPILDPETRLPTWERESTPLLLDDQILELKRQIALAAGIELADIPEKVEVSQVAWMPPVYAPSGSGPYYLFVWNRIKDNSGLIITGVILVVVLYIAYHFASKPLPTEVDDSMEHETLSLAMTQEAEDEEQSDEEWDKLRAKVTAAVQEDPKRAAGLLKRWMRKD